jgi:hypothetical protein
LIGEKTTLLDGQNCNLQLGFSVDNLRASCPDLLILLRVSRVITIRSGADCDN